MKGVARRKMDRVPPLHQNECKEVDVLRLEEQVIRQPRPIAETERQRREGNATTLQEPERPVPAYQGPYLPYSGLQEGRTLTSHITIPGYRGSRTHVRADASRPDVPSLHREAAETGVQFQVARNTY